MVSPFGLPEPILVVDDDPFVCTVVAAALAAAGVQAVCCGSGEEALARIAEVKPALILLDYVMPGLNGRATWKALRERMTALDLPAPRGIFLTARNAVDIAPAAFDTGIAGVIAKPFDPAMLVSELRRVLHLAESVPASAGAARLAVVATEFRRALPAAADHIEALGHELQTGGWRSTTAEALLARAHALAGSAGLFGLHALGAAAGVVEGLLLNYLKLEAAPGAPEMRKLGAAAITLVGHCRDT